MPAPRSCPYCVGGRAKHPFASVGTDPVNSTEPAGADLMVAVTDELGPNPQPVTTSVARFASIFVAGRSTIVAFPLASRTVTWKSPPGGMGSPKAAAHA